jgi:hypothetical protein
VGRRTIVDDLGVNPVADVSQLEPGTADNLVERVTPMLGSYLECWRRQLTRNQQVRQRSACCGGASHRKLRGWRAYTFNGVRHPGNSPPAAHSCHHVAPFPEDSLATVRVGELGRLDHLVR